MRSDLMSDAHYEYFPHQQDLGLRGVGWTLAEAFEQVAQALCGINMALENIQETEQIQLECHAPSQENLLEDWINAIIYEMGMRHVILKRFQVSISGHSLHGQALGEKLNTTHTRFVVDPKAVLAGSGLLQKELEGRWVAQCVVKV